MKKILLLTLLLFSVNVYAEHMIFNSVDGSMMLIKGKESFKNCTKNELETVWGDLHSNKIYTNKERFCLALRTIKFIEDTYQKYILPLSPEEKKWVETELNYVKKIGRQDSRSSNFLNHSLWFRHKIIENCDTAKKNLSGVMKAINNSQSKLEMKYWAKMAADWMYSDTWTIFRNLCSRGVIDDIECRSDAFNHIYLPAILVKGVVQRD